MIPVGIVIPWFGAALKGGAEQQAWQVATRLTRRGHPVEVLTTCCREFAANWGENHLPAGLGSEQGVAVRRFPVDAGDRAAFNRVNRRLLELDRSDLKPGVCPVPRADAETFAEHNVNSTALLVHLRQNRDGYRAFLFLPYLYGPTLRGLPLVADRAFLQPCLHDEAYAYLPHVEHAVRCAKGLLFDSEEDAVLAARLYGPGVWPRAAIVGDGRDGGDVSDRLEEALGLRGGSAPPPARPARVLREVHQLMPNLAYGDAVSNHALAVRDHLRGLGYRSEVFAHHVGARVRDQAELYKRGCVPRDAGLIYHHAVGCDLAEDAARHPGPRCLIYHNITPTHFYAPYRPDVAAIVARGRADLPRLARYFPLSVGDSAFNAAELRDCGFDDPGVLPIPVEPGKWNVPADPGLMRLLQDGRTNLLFTGRFAPNKCQHHLVAAFAHYLEFDPDARLILVGNLDPKDPYNDRVRGAIDEHRVGGQVVVTGHVTDGQLTAYYRTAHLFWSMTEHEGFCVPLIEAMWFDVPVLAYRSTAVPETLGGSRFLFTDKRDLRGVAGLAALLVRDRGVREKVQRAQRARRRAFLPGAVWEKFDAILRALERQHEKGRVRRPAVRA